MRLAKLGASVHLAHPLGVKAFSYRRVKNDQRDAADLADLLRMGVVAARLDRSTGNPGAARCGTGPTWSRRHPAPRPRCAVLAEGGVWVRMTDLFGVAREPAAGQKLNHAPPYMARIASLRRFIEAFDAEIDLFTGLAQRSAGARSLTLQSSRSRPPRAACGVRRRDR